MKTVAQILKSKGSRTWSVTPETSVFDALKLMAEKNVGALIVLDNQRVAGIFSERDYARKIILLGKTSKETPVRDVMSEKVLFVTPDRTLDECMAIMTEKHIRHIPVLEGDSLAGVISIGDVVKGVISQQRFEIDQLHKYITGER